MLGLNMIADVCGRSFFEFNMHGSQYFVDNRTGETGCKWQHLWFHVAHGRTICQVRGQHADDHDSWKVHASNMESLDRFNNSAWCSYNSSLPTELRANNNGQHELPARDRFEDRRGQHGLRRHRWRGQRFQQRWGFDTVPALRQLRVVNIGAGVTESPPDEWTVVQHFLNILLESQLHLNLQFGRLRWTIPLNRGHGKLDPSDSTGWTCAHQLLVWRNTTKDGCMLLARWHHDGEEQGPHNGPHQRISWVCINSGATHDRWAPACPTSAAPTSRWRGDADNRWCADGRNTGRANIWQQVRKGHQKGVRLTPRNNSLGWSSGKTLAPTGTKPTGRKSTTWKLTPESSDEQACIESQQKTPFVNTFRLQRCTGWFPANINIILLSSTEDAFCQHF